MTQGSPVKKPLKLVPYAHEIIDEEYRAKFLNGLHERIELHPGQVRIAQAVFAGKNTVASCGRKFGKSSLVQYIALRKAALLKKAYIYVILPSLKQAKEIYWEQLIIPDICPPGFIQRMDRGDVRITMKSGSFIKFDGSDNTELHRGPACHYFVLDEMKDCNPRLLPAMLPNLLATRGTFSMFGTPPDEEESPGAKMWFEMCDRHVMDPRTVYFEGKSEENPFNDKAILRGEKERLMATGQEDVWLREYCGVYRRSTAESIFPMWDDGTHTFEHEVLEEEIREILERHPDDLQFWCIQDPGSSSVFAQLFLAYHKPTATVYVLDESYVTDPKKATVIEMYRLEVEKMGAIHGDLAIWENVYDEQASWFYNERAQIGLADGLIPTEKNKWRSTNDKDVKAGLTVARDILTYRRLRCSKRCKNFISEMKNYRRAQIKRKAKDHLIDCLRYFILKSYYTIPEEIIKDMSTIPVAIQKKISETPKKASRDVSEEIEGMIENDITEYITSEALAWLGW